MSVWGTMDRSYSKAAHSKAARSKDSSLRRTESSILGKGTSRSTEGLLYQVHAGWEDASFQKSSFGSPQNRALLSSQEHQTQASQKPAVPSWKILDFGRSKLLCLPPEIALYQFLVEIDLQKNFLQEISPALCLLPELRRLDVSENMIKEIPPEICKLTKLERLVANDNMIRTFPPEMGGLWRLTGLVLDGNPLDDVYARLYHTHSATDTVMHIRETLPVTTEPPERIWHFVDAGPDQQPTFTLYTHNILANTFTSSQIYGYVPKNALRWDHRRALLLTDIMMQHPDIVCLQEIELQHYETYFAPQLKKSGGYASCHLLKTRSKTVHQVDRQSVDGCAVFYRETRYTLKEQYSIEFSVLALQKSDLRSSSDMFQRLQTKQNVALAAVLLERHAQKRILCANLHLHWNPQEADVKLMQAILFLEELERIRAASQPDIVLVAGDFNSLPGSGVHTLFSTGAVPPDHPDFMHFSYGKYTQKGFHHNFHFASAYAKAKEMPFTCFTGSFQGTIDYIWYSERHVAVSGLLGPVEPEYIQRTVGFPNMHYPSDHIPLCAELSVKEHDETVDFVSVDESTHRNKSTE